MDNARLTLDPQFIKPLVQLADLNADLNGDLNAYLNAALNAALDAVDAALDAGSNAALNAALDAVDAALDATKSPIKSTGTLTIGEREIKFKVQDVSVSRGEVLLWTDKGTITLVVDRYGDRLTWEVFDWDLEDEVNA